MHFRWTPIVLACAALVHNSHGQALDSRGDNQQASHKEGQVALSTLDGLVLLQYRPQHVSAPELLDVARNLIGRQLFIQETANIRRAVNNLSYIGGQIIVYDTEEYASRVIDMLASLDVASEDPESASDRQNDREIMLEYTARHVPVSSLNNALRSFGDLQFSTVGSRMITARVHEQRRDELLSYLNRIDQPDPCVLLTCYLLQGGTSSMNASGPQPPADVIAHLNSIMPDMQFSSIGFSMVQTALSNDRQVQLSVKGSNQKAYELSFVPLAFDQGSGDMTVLNCEVLVSDESIAPVQGPPLGRRLLLRTDTVFRGGEYTILGASGQDPVFIVVHNRSLN